MLRALLCVAACGGVAGASNCTRHARPRRPAHALGVPFQGEGGRRGFRAEDEYVFTNFFSRDGAPPYKQNGTYVELGALDGVLASNTFWFERALGWHGLLIEPSAKAHQRLVENRGGAQNNVIRHAVVCPAGQTVEYLEPARVQDVATAGIATAVPEGNKRYAHMRTARRRPMACVPLNELLLSAQLRHVDFFSLDVEGAELTVLKTIDWDATTFGVLMVELDGKNSAKDDEVRSLLSARGYSRVERTGLFCYAEVWRGPAAASQGPAVS